MYKFRDPGPLGETWQTVAFPGRRALGWAFVAVKPDQVLQIQAATAATRAYAQLGA